MKTCEEKDKKWEMDTAFIYRVSNNLITDATEMLGSAYLFNKAVAAASPLVPRTSLATGFFRVLIIRCEFLPVDQALSPIRKFVLSIATCVTILVSGLYYCLTLPSQSMQDLLLRKTALAAPSSTIKTILRGSHISNSSLMSPSPNPSYVMSSALVSYHPFLE